MTEIGANAFRNCSLLNKIELPNTLITIKNNAFYGCESLNSIIIPNSVTTMLEAVFQYCTSLETITMSSNVTAMHTYMFYQCTSLKTINNFNVKSVVKNGSAQSLNFARINTLETINYSGTTSEWEDLFESFDDIDKNQFKTQMRKTLTVKCSNGDLIY